MNLPPRILFVTESFGVGGTENHLLALLPALKGRGFEVAAFCFTARGSRARRLEEIGIPVHVAPPLGQSKRSVLAPLRMIGGAVRLFTLIKRFRPSIIHFYLPAPYLVGAPVAIAARVPIKLMSRRSMADYQTKWPGAAATERLLHTRMDALLGNARAVTDELLREGCPEAKVHLIYNGVRPPDAPVNRAEARDALGLDAQIFVVTTVANLLPYKGHLDLVATLAEIAGRLPQPWVVLFAGRDGGSRTATEQAIAQAGLGENIRLLGERSDVSVLLAASDLGVIAPTRNEGFSNALLEFMAAGLPVVVTDVGGNAEAVLDGETGLVVPPHDTTALGAAILALAEDPARRRTMGERARNRAADEFSLEKPVDQYCALYEMLLARGGRAAT